MTSPHASPDGTKPGATATAPDGKSDLSHLAQLVGYESEPSSVAVPSIDTEQPLLDDADFHEPLKAKRPVWENPFAKAGLIAGFTGFVAALILIGLNIFQSPARFANQPQVQPQPEEAPEIDPEALDPELGRMKTVAAVGNQAHEIQAASDPRFATTEGTDSVPPQATTPPPRTASPPVAATAPTYSAPSPSRYSPPSAPRPTPRPAAAPVSPVITTATSTMEKRDPAEIWESSRAVGSYGVVPVAVSSAVGSPLIDTMPSPSSTAPVQLAQNSWDEQLYRSDEQAILSGAQRYSHTIAAGAAVRGELVTPVIWAPDLPAEEQPQRFAMRIDEPLVDASGMEVFPAGTQLMLVSGGMTDSGFMDLSVVGAIPPGRNQSGFVPLPGGVLTVTDDDGEPLVAEEISNVRGQVARLDRNLAMMGALSGLGEFVTRPDETTTTTNFRSTTSSENPDLNPLTILGSMARGAFEPLQAQWTDRNESRIDELLSRSRVWYLGSGTEVTVYAQDTFSVMK